MKHRARPFPVLGTAMWGWTLSRAQCFRIADAFFDRGGQWFDTASNYPIDSRPDHFGLSESWLAKWVERRAGAKVIAKIGAVANDGRPENDLSASAVSAAYDRLRSRFGQNLANVCVHWDNREDGGAIAETVAALNRLSGDGVGVGLSGIRRPDLYFDASEALRKKWRIQIKNNALTEVGYSRYALFHGERRFHAYGLNAAGIKLDGAKSRTLKARRGRCARPEMEFVANLARATGSALDRRIDMNALGILLACSNQDIEAILLGASNVDQVFDTLDFLEEVDDAMISAFAEVRRDVGRIPPEE